MYLLEKSKYLNVFANILTSKFIVSGRMNVLLIRESFNGTVVDRTCPSSNIGSLDNTTTVPLTDKYLCM